MAKKGKTLEDRIDAIFLHLKGGRQTNATGIAIDLGFSVATLHATIKHINENQERLGFSVCHQWGSGPQWWIVSHDMLTDDERVIVKECMRQTSAREVPRLQHNIRSLEMLDNMSAKPRSTKRIFELKCMANGFAEIAGLPAPYPDVPSANDIPGFDI